VLWLLRNDCDYFGLTLSVWPENLDLEAGAVTTLSYHLSASGACPATGVLISNLVPVGIEIVSAELRFEPVDATEGEVRRDGQLLRFGMSRLPSATAVLMDVKVRAPHGGTFTNTVAMRANFRSFQPIAISIHVDGQTPALPSLRCAVQGDRLVLCLDEAPPCDARVEVSTDLQTWAPLGPSYLFDADEELQCLDPITPNSLFRFYRMACE
jgi:hypothetical protein